MIHPQYWSLNSIWERLTHVHPEMHLEDYDSLDVKGKVVIDGGAYDGDSSLYFLRRGAKHVISIEKDVSMAVRIPNDERITVLAEPFKLEHLALPHDCMKLDIEGYEMLLLDYEGELKPTIMEVHNWYERELFERIGFHVIRDKMPGLEMLGVCIMVNY